MLVLEDMQVDKMPDSWKIQGADEMNYPNITYKRGCNPCNKGKEYPQISYKPSLLREQGKEPWQMTRKEYRALIFKDFPFQRVESDRAQTYLANRLKEHYVAVEKAIKEGKAVSRDVLWDYPDLQESNPTAYPEVSYSTLKEKVTPITPRITKVDWDKVEFGEGISPQLQVDIKKMVDELPFDIKANLRDIKIGKTMTPFIKGEYEHATQTITFRSAKDMADPETFYHELGHSISHNRREVEGTQFLLDYADAIGRGEEARRLVPKAEADMFVARMEDLFAKDFSRYSRIPRYMPKETLKFFESRFPTAIPKAEELTQDTIDYLAKTEGDPLRKFCCRQCSECAPKELLEEGRFADRIAWLRHHYKEKHPSTWGKEYPEVSYRPSFLREQGKKPWR